ncbi:MAG: hypothetical protein ACOXZM_10385 [Eubacteriales bacterium]|jgi:hypothetical protein
MKIGFGEGIITPPGRVSLRGQYHIRVSETPREDIRAIAMAVTDGDTTIFWVACDLCAIDDPLPADVYSLTKDILPVREDGIILSATHIHTGPYLVDTISGLNGNRMIPDGTTSADDCRRAVAEGIVTAMKAAYDARRDCTLSATCARTRTGVNRRIRYTDNSAVMYGSTARKDFVGSEGRDGGPTQLLYVRDTKGELYGVIADVPCTAQVVEGKNYITPDYPGAAREILARELPNVTLMTLIGAAGDLSPHILIERVPGDPNDRDEDGREAFGRLLAEMVLEHRDDAYDVCEKPEMRYVCENVTLPVWASTDAEYEEAKTWLAELRKQYGDDLNYEKMIAQGFRDTLRFSKALAEIKRHNPDPDVFDVRVHALRLGNVAFITNPFELYVEYADRMKAALRGVQVFDVELTGHCPGYLATVRGTRGGGYSATIFSGRTSPAGGEILTKASIQALKRIFDR